MVDGTHTAPCLISGSQSIRFIMESVKDVSLHIYELRTTPDEQQQQQQSAGMRAAGFFSRMLPSLGMGAYHTSLEVNGDRYTFAANAGIIKSRSRNEAVPPGANYKESIDLGACSVTSAELNSIVSKLRSFFGPTSYHLVHRNCNHFSETFATAVILKDSLTDPKCKRLDTYPEWVNRLAYTSQTFVSHDADIVSCNVMDEARKAVGADDKLGWDFDEKGETKGKKSSSRKSSSKKKELTDKQKDVLAKLKSKK